MTDFEALTALRASSAFDAHWYAEAHADVAASGLDAAEHYLRFGSLMDRDPAPDVDAAFHRIACRHCTDRHALPGLCPGLFENTPKGDGSAAALGIALDGIKVDRVLLAASAAAAIKGAEVGAVLAEAHLPDTLAHTALPLRANAALESGDELGWTQATNAYLAHVGGMEVALRPGTEPAFARLAPARDPHPISDGPMISVIMPAWNSETTIAIAVRSILKQSWRNLELIVVDDASTDGTWMALQSLAAGDDRVRLMRNVANVGPYVSKNLALRIARGEWITGHDADDWAHPERIARHIETAAREGGGVPVRASLPHMLRVQPDGRFSFLSQISAFSFDGAARRCSVATLFRADFLRAELGAWDSVRFDADSEMISRASAALGDEFRILRDVSTMCLDLPTSLTNLPGIGLNRADGKGAIRRTYKTAWRTDHKNRARTGDFHLPFPQPRRRVAAPPEMVPPIVDIRRNMC